jgi:DNA repair exonuclease SbcCD ATPase subunit
MRPTQDLVSGLGGLESQRERELDMSEKYQTLREAEFQQCPTCEQEIDMEFVDSQYKKHISKANDILYESSQVHSKLEELDNENQIHRQAARNISDWETVFRSIDTRLPTRVLDKEKVESQIRELEDKVKAARETLEGVIDENTRRERHNTRISIIGEQTDQFETELAGITNTLGDIEDKLSVLEILKKAFSTNGLLAYKIESLVKELESLTNEYLAEFSDGRFSINFVVENDKLNVEVGDNGKIIDILALSSGELARVNIATLVAIRKLMTSISRSQINVLFLDEVNQALDEAGKEKVVEILLKEETLNTFLVSHGWTHPLLEKIEILKEDNISILEAYHLPRQMRGNA